MTTFNLVVLRARNPGELARFYEGLGLRFVEHRHGNGPLHYACEEEGGMVFEIYPRKDGATGTAGALIGFAVDSVDDSLAQLMESGAEVVTKAQESEWGRRAVVRDSEGHVVETCEGR